MFAVSPLSLQAHEYRRTSGLQLRDADVRVKILERGIAEKRRVVDATTTAHQLFRDFCIGGGIAEPVKAPREISLDKCVVACLVFSLFFTKPLSSHQI